MSFLGSIAGPLRRVIAAYADELTAPVLLPCAGNFTVGAGLRSGGYRGRITGCAITLYTSALGAYLAGDHLQVAERDDCPEHLRGLLDLSDSAYLAASVSIMLDLRQVWQCKNVWHRRVLGNYRRNWPQLMEKTLAKLDAYRAHLNQGGGFGYVPQDAAAFLREHDPDHAVFIAPPTFGSRDYINQERMLAAAATWPAPEYTEISFKDVSIYEQITSFREWMIIMERPLPEVEKILGEPVAVVHKGRKSITYAYAGHSRRRIITREFPQSRPHLPGQPVSHRTGNARHHSHGQKADRADERTLHVRTRRLLSRRRGPVPGPLPGQENYRQARLQPDQIRLGAAGARPSDLPAVGPGCAECGAAPCQAGAHAVPEP